MSGIGKLDVKLKRESIKKLNCEKRITRFVSERFVVVMVVVLFVLLCFLGVLYLV